MDADWYEDPLGRFEGRFFDGEQWTERVSDDGVLSIDPDFPPEAKPADEFESGPPAVASIGPGRQLRASLIEESPARVVAVLDASVSRLPRGAGSGGSDDVGSRGGSRRRAPIVWALLGLIAALVVAALVVLGSNDDPAEAIAEPVQLDGEQEARVQDLEDGGIVDQGQSMAEELEIDAPAGAVDPDAVFAADQAIQVGSLRVLNGQGVLDELEQWHTNFASDRGVELSPIASCWFGQLGGAAVQVAHCGPVGGSAASEFVFDAIPLLFEEADGGQIAQPVVDAVNIDAPLANALTLVNANGEISPSALEVDG